MNTKKSPEKSNAEKQGSHPETKKEPKKTGTPGTESSEAQGTARDERNRHDQDGNSQQRPS